MKKLVKYVTKGDEMKKRNNTHKKCSQHFLQVSMRDMFIHITFKKYSIIHGNKQVEVNRV